MSNDGRSTCYSNPCQKPEVKTEAEAEAKAKAKAKSLSIAANLNFNIQDIDDGECAAGVYDAAKGALDQADSLKAATIDPLDILDKAFEGVGVSKVETEAEAEAEAEAESKAKSSNWNWNFYFHG